MALAAGIFFSDHFLSDKNTVVWWLGGCLFLTVALMVWTHLRVSYRYRFVFGVFSCLSFGLVGAMLTQLEKEKVGYEWPGDNRVYIGMLEEPPVRTARSWQLTVEVEAARDTSLGWRRVGRKAIVYQIPDSTCKPLSVGDRICFYARMTGTSVQAASPVGFDYESHLVRRGIGGVSTLYPGRLMVLPADDRGSIPFRLKALLWREHIVSVFHSWQLSPDVQAVVAALTVGDKRGLSSDLKSSYNASGTSHVLALSGLHVGLLSAILLFVLSPLRRITGGRWLLVTISVCTLWLFAFLAGLSPSVVRAVCMFSFYEVAFILSENRFSGFYPLVLTTFCMLVYCPFYLFDASFQLSFVAVFSIFSFYPYLSRLINIRYGVLRFFYNAISLSFSAQLGTLPLVLYYFGAFPVYFLLANIVVTPLVLCVLLFTLLALALSCLSLLTGYLLFPLDWSVRLLNAIMEWVSSLPGAQITSVHISIVQSVLMLFSLYGLALLLSKFSFRRMVCMLFGLDMLLVSMFIDNFYHQEILLFYHKSVYIRSNHEQSKLASKHNIYKVKNLQIGLMDDARWRGLVSSDRMTLHYVYLCNGYRGKITDLLSLFNVQTVIFDSGLNEKYKKRLKKECDEFGIGYIDLSGKGSYSILL